jgi:molybdenum cofactor cytidylyltransferase
VVSPPVLSIVLAAGQGTRLGGPKAMLAWCAAPAPARPLAAAHAAARLAAESDEVVVVLRAPIVPLLTPWLPARAVAIASDASEHLGPAGSIACAAQWLARERPGPWLAALALLTPVDCPPASADVTAALLAALRGSPALLAARPMHAGRRGHPVVVRAELLRRQRAPEPLPLRTLLAALGDSVVDVVVDDPEVLVDLDSPAELTARGLGPARFITGPP